MAEPIRTALYLDYDGLLSSLSAADEKAAMRLAARAAVWVAAIEAGDLVTPSDKPRRVELRRCYADPDVLADDADILTDAGFEIVACPAANGDAAAAIALQMAIDVASAAAAGAHEEFILLSTGDLSTLIGHLKARKLASAVYVTGKDTKGNRQRADAAVEEQALASLLSAEDAPEAKPSEVVRVDRDAIEALARKVHRATNVPLFSPKTFGELFRQLTAEIADNGYHFRSTAENVAARMTEAGRTVTRRQVMFVVKGLALKGHVFSTSDTPERLAEVFREQVVYLAEHSGITFAETDDQLLTAWICGRAAAAKKQEAAPQEPPAKSAQEDAKPRPEVEAATKRSAETATKRQAEAAAKRRSQAEAETAKKTKGASPEQETAPDDAPEPEEAEPATEPVVAGAEPSDAKTEESVEDAETADAPEAAESEAKVEDKPPETTAAEKPVGDKAASGRSPSTDRKAAIAARIAAAAKPLLRGVSKTPSAEPQKPAPAKAAPKTSPPADDLIESSILAAIAEAVDVLVEDSAKPASKKRAQPADAPEPSSAVEELPDPIPSDGGDSDDIGDEIQRIIASYNRNRKKDDG